jgi:ribonuclease Z
MDLQVVFLGTAGSIPTTQRALPAIAVKRKDELILFDCGEGAQRQMIRAKVAFHKKTKVFITHMHGDHVLGLPGLLQTMALLDRKRELEIYGPVGVKTYICAMEETVQFGRTFPIVVTEIAKEGTVCEEKEYRIETAKADHVVNALAYALVEKSRPGRFNQERAKKLGVPEGPLWSKLQHGENIKLSGGKIVRPEDVLGKLRPGRKIVYTGDTRPTQALIKLAKNADLLIHEATLGDELKERADEDGHSTPSEAAEVAKKAKVKRLVLTHISARYKSAETLLKQAKKIFKNVDVAEDFMRIELKQPN